MTQDKSGEYWMIEKIIGGAPHWWVRAAGQFEHWNLPHRWTTDPNKAKHYGSKREAELIIGRDMVGCVATRHGGAPDETKGAQGETTASPGETKPIESKSEVDTVAEWILLPGLAKEISCEIYVDAIGEQFIVRHSSGGILKHFRTLAELREYLEDLANRIRKVFYPSATE